MNTLELTMRPLLIQRLQALLHTARHLCGASGDRPALAQGTSLQARVQATLLPGTLHTHGQLHSACWQVAWVSATGLRHLAQDKGCEDSCQAQSIGPQGAMHLAVADGVSQGARGDLASATAAQAVMQAPEYQAGKGREPYAHTLQEAEAQVQAALQAVTQSRGATTLACGWLGQGGQGFVSRVGDCRVYAWQAPQTLQAEQPTSAPMPVQVSQLLPDQSYTQLGETPRSGIHPNNPARMLGVGVLGTPDILPIEVPLGAGLILSSDGMHDVMTPQAWASALAPLAGMGSTHHTPPHDLGTLLGLCAQLVRQAQDSGSDDDVSVMLVRRVG
jgi:serine/threonine protein phosphatase PrpC